jgi:TIR domain
MVRVFLSHSRKDKTFVRDLAAALEAGARIKVWLDEREIDYGQNIVLRITRTFLLSLPPTASCRVPFGGTGAWWDTRGNPRDPGASASLAQMAVGPKPEHQARQPDVQSSYRW